MHYSVASALASFLSVALLHWMETIKYRRQLGDHGTVLEHGVLALNKGLALNLVANTAAWSISMSSKAWLEQQQRVPYWFVLCAAPAIATVLTNWLWVAKSHQQTKGRIPWSTEFLYRGLDYSILINALYGGVNYALYDTFHAVSSNAALSAAVSKLVALLLTYNLQRKRLETQLDQKTHYAGLRWSIARSVLQNVVVFYTYDMLKD